MTPPLLTREQKKFMNEMDAKHKEFMAGIKAEMIAQNESSTKSKRLILDESHDSTTLLHNRLPISMVDAMIEMGQELNASRSYIVYHLLRFAITHDVNEHIQGIALLSSFKEYRNSFKK